MKSFPNYIFLIAPWKGNYLATVILENCSIITGKDQKELDKKSRKRQKRAKKDRKELDRSEKNYYWN